MEFPENRKFGHNSIHFFVIGRIKPWIGVLQTGASRNYNKTYLSLVPKVFTFPTNVYFCKEAIIKNDVVDFETAPDFVSVLVL